LNNRIRRCLGAVFLAAFLFSAWQLYIIYSEYAAAEKQYSQLEQYVYTDTASPPPSSSQSVPEENTSPWPQVDFAALRQINPDIVGWLYIEGTQINYPVVQGENNDYYLNHQFDRSYNSAGCLFLDAANSPLLSDRNSIIYGHHMKNKSMFHSLTKYKQQAFFDAHPTAWLVTPAQSYQIQFFSGYVSDTAGAAWNIDSSEADYEAWLSAAKEKSCFVSPILPTAQNRVVTLSTCSYEFQNARFVVHGLLSAQDAS